MDSTILKKAAVLLRKQGKNVLAKSLEDQVEVMVKMEKATAPMPASEAGSGLQVREGRSLEFSEQAGDHQQDQASLCRLLLGPSG